MRVFKKQYTDHDVLIIFNVEPGELLLESIINYLKDNSIKNTCVISGIGTLSKLTYHRILTTDYDPQNEFIVTEGPIELSSTQGLILDYEPHLHFVASDLKNTYSGHLEYDSAVLYLAEFVLITLNNFDLKRYPDERNVFYIQEVK
ncbi:MAG TPA: DNA-binding protein [Dictyoglomaceae bacterium]|nr:DNA-binding protein [Dictyoglomaceae bacterium]HOL39462.1 DNA-binding protein [Dictyoglomaceae bacterium]HPP15397.1 DNA-binding protein [Dictyoglomaceae bacterium]HPU43835.1 DNA-binding protein [Dictyoglomaceae bacterium]